MGRPHPPEDGGCWMVVQPFFLLFLKAIYLAFSSGVVWTSVMPALGRLRQEDLKSSLGYVRKPRSYLKKRKNL
jgi:hypothetical protein